jgi:ubiquinone/menaquinone biosynthesis C-methylase UbiE
MKEKAALDGQYWASLREKSELAGITLDASISAADFETYGDRLAARALDVFRRYGSTPLERSTIVDVGCGMGRLSLPFSRHVAKVIGVDINRRILDAGILYCKDASNIEFVENDGQVLPIGNNSVDYVYSGGVLQHIKELDVIKGYFREGLRILKPGGTLLYVIMTWMDDVLKGSNIGKRLRAADVEDALKGMDCRVATLIEDPKDPVPHLLIALRKEPGTARLTKSMVQQEDYRTGIWEDLPSYENFRKLWTGKRRP